MADLTAGGAADDSDLMVAAAATEEALKFIPEGADRVPSEAIRSADGQQVYAQDPGRFSRRRLAAVAAAYREQAAKTARPDHRLARGQRSTTRTVASFAHRMPSSTGRGTGCRLSHRRSSGTSSPASSRPAGPFGLPTAHARPASGPAW